MPGEPRYREISRILFSLQASGSHLSRSVTRAPRTTLAAPGTLDASAQPKWYGVRLIPEDPFHVYTENRAGDPLLCFVLHHMGFLMRPRLHESPVGSYPAFSTLLRTIFERQARSQFRVSLRPKMVRGGMFSVILSVIWGLGPKFPRFREACCLLVFGLSSGATKVAPATTYHKAERNTKNRPIPLAAFFSPEK